MEFELSGDRFLLQKSKLKSGASVYFVDLLEDDKLCNAVAAEILALMKDAGIADMRPVIVAPEVKAIPLAKTLADLADTRFAIARKEFYDISVGAKPSVRSFSAGSQRYTFQFSPETARRLRGQSIVIVDDVVTTGETLSAVLALCEAQNAKVLAVYAGFQEGGTLKHLPFDVRTLCKLPLDDVSSAVGQFDHFALRAGTTLPTVYTAMSKLYFCYRTQITRFAIDSGYAPFNPFMSFDFALHGLCRKEDVIRANNTMLEKCDEVWHFGPISDGSLAELILAKRSGKSIHFFDLDKTWKPTEITGPLVVFEEDRLVAPFRELFEDH